MTTNISGYVRIWTPRPNVGPYIEGFEYYLIDKPVWFYLGAATTSISLRTLYKELHNAAPDAYLVIAPGDDGTALR